MTTAQTTILNDLNAIIKRAEQIIYREEGAHTSERWHDLLELHSTTEFLVKLLADDQPEENLKAFIRESEAELDAWSRH